MIDKKINNKLKMSEPLFRFRNDLLEDKYYFMRFIQHGLDQEKFVTNEECEDLLNDVSVKVKGLNGPHSKEDVISFQNSWREE